MVLHKRLDYGSTGRQVPPMLHVPKSARGKRSVRKKTEQKPITAFDLLATVAGELLTAGSSNPVAKNDVETSLKAEVFDQGSCNESTLGSDTVLNRQVGYSLKEHPKTLKSSEIDAGDEFRCALPAVAKDGKGNCDSKSDVGIKTPPQSERRANGNIKGENVSEILEDPMDLDAKPPPPLVSSDSSVEVPISRNGSLLVDRDDDENSSGCTHPSTSNAKSFRPQRIGDRRIRKLLASRFWRAPSPALKDGDLSNADVEMKPVFRNRTMCYTRQRTQRSSFKRRKLFERRSVSASAGCTFGEVNGVSSSTSDQKSIYESGDYHVKFSIKSFKVPELFIEIPETATVGSLKRTVMEAVTAILAGGLRVGVLLQGKKVRDDKLTLLQAGISSNEKMENLGFTLEPNSTHTQPSPLAYPEYPNSLLPSPAAEPVPRSPIAVPAIDQVPAEASLEPVQTSTLNGPESDHDSVHSHTDASSSSKALVPISDINVDPMAMASPRKSRQSELVQRRIRRPFSVAEVEALVQAVEKLGTGRWRDVKIRAFDNSKHRTYVDLKDKWKTLVHTARISPQQRRGEPVPQELLDRVLSAHAYWSQQQAKLQVKPSQAEAYLLI